MQRALKIKYKVCQQRAQKFTNNSVKTKGNQKNYSEINVNGTN